jgi:hypothetical protein
LVVVVEAAGAEEEAVEDAVGGAGLHLDDVSAVADGAISVVLLDSTQLEVEHNLLVGEYTGHFSFKVFLKLI